MKGLFALITLGFLLALAAADLDSEFEAFKVKYNKHYSGPAEEAQRKETFRHFWELLKRGNERYANKEVDFYIVVTKDFDRTDEEMKARHQ